MRSQGGLVDIRNILWIFYNLSYSQIVDKVLTTCVGFLFDFHKSISWERAKSPRGSHPGI